MNIDSSTVSKYAQLMMRPAQDKGEVSEFWADFSLNMTEVEVSVSATDKASEPRTVEDVKREFYSYLDSLALSPGLSGTGISVNVTEAAFEKMLADPDYEQKMKDLCARDLCDPNWSRNVAMGLKPSALTITIDADCKDEYLATSYNHPSYANKADGDSFWNKRTKNGDSARKAQEKREQEKQEMLEIVEKRAAKRRDMYMNLLTTGATGTEAVFVSSSCVLEGTDTVPQ